MTLEGYPLGVFFCFLGIPCLFIVCVIIPVMIYRYTRKRKSTQLALEKTEFRELQQKNDDDCAICMEEVTVGDTEGKLPCQHAFHKQCIKQWITTKYNPNCPECRDIINEDISPLPRFCAFFTF